MRRFLGVSLALLIAGGIFGGMALTAQDSFSGMASDRVVLFPLKRTVLASEVDGVVKVISQKEGATFKAGDALFELDDRLYKESLDKAEAAKAEAEAGLKYAVKALEQMKALASKGGAGKQELERAILDKESAEAKFRFAAAGLEMAKLSLASCIVKAPYDGTLVKRLAAEGEYVKAGQPVAETHDDLCVLAVVNLPSSDVTMLGGDSKCTVRIDETRTEHEGRIYERAGAINPAGRTIEVKFLIDNSGRKLVPGMSGTLVRKQFN